MSPSLPVSIYYVIFPFQKLLCIELKKVSPYECLQRLFPARPHRANQKRTTMKSLPIIYLTSLGIIFTISFISYYVQYPALSSKSGIEPCERVFQGAYPKLYTMTIEKGYFDVDTFVDFVCLLGIMVSITIAR